MESVLRRIVWLWRDMTAPAGTLNVSASKLPGAVGTGRARFTTLHLTLTLASGLAVIGIVLYARRRMLSLRAATGSEGLSRLLSRRYAEAVSQGYVKPLKVADGAVEVVVDSGGMPFMLTLGDPAAVAMKPVAPSRNAGFSRVDAFKSIPAAMTVAHLPEPGVRSSHTLVLNRSPLYPNHVVLVAADPLSQAAPMSLADMTVLWRTVRRLDALAFYNSGVHSGGSQPRRHTQCIPIASLPQAAVPLQRVIHAAMAQEGYRIRPHEVTRLQALPFQHAFAQLGGDDLARDDNTTASALYATYVSMLERMTRLVQGRIITREDVEAAARLRMGEALPGDAAPFLSHNVLLTSQWMLCVPRTQADVPLESGEGYVSVNALAYAGLMLVLRPQDAPAVRTMTPMRILQQAGFMMDGGAV